MSQQKSGASDDSYRFRFFRVLVNNVGRSFPSTIDTIQIRRARNEHRARLAALRRFERKHRVQVWHHLAHGCERDDRPEAL